MNEATSPENRTYSMQQTLAFIIAFGFVSGPAFFYWQLDYLRWTLFGRSHPLVVVCAISALGGFASLALYSNQRRLLAGLLGALAGLGAAASLISYTTVFDREKMATVEIVLVQSVGAAPAFAILAYVNRKSVARPKQP